MSDKKDIPKEEMDPELDDLLDSALQDMTKKPKEGEGNGSSEVPQNLWSEEFIKEAAAQFESNMAALMGNFGGSDEPVTQEQIAATFSKMAEAAAQVLKPQGEAGGDEPAAADDPAIKEKIDEVSAAISQTLQNLNTNSANLQTPFSDNDLANMFNSFNLNDPSQDSNMYVPFMQGMMQSLLSKEVLYPSLKDLLEKYPPYLAANKDKIEKEEFERFEKQQELMQKVCAELEPEQDSDPEDVKRKRFETVLALMQEMQDLGQPPLEIVGEIGPPPQGLAPLPGQDAGQCSIM